MSPRWLPMKPAPPVTSTSMAPHAVAWGTGRQHLVAFMLLTILLPSPSTTGTPPLGLEHRDDGHRVHDLARIDHGEHLLEPVGPHLERLGVVRLRPIHAAGRSKARNRWA